MVVAALQGGAVYVIRRNADGSLGEIVHTAHMAGKKEGAISFAHQCIWDQKKEYLLLYARRDCRAMARSSYSISIRWTAA